MKNPMKIAEKYASEIREKMNNGSDGNTLLMYYAEKMGKETRNNYFDCKQMIAFYFGKF